MRSSDASLIRRLRALVWAAPVLAAWQSGCEMSGSSCDDFVSRRLTSIVPLEASDAGVEGGVIADCEGYCLAHGAAFGTHYSCAVQAGDDVVACSFDTVCEGRRPAGYRAARRGGAGPVLGRYFASMARAEEASVVAFERLAAELAEHGAPRALVRGAARAARDERRHHRLAGSLARRFGARAQGAKLGAAEGRSLRDLAIENAREGMVRETIGAALGLWQAAHAGEPAVRAALESIARDELRHAAWSWELDAWARTRLAPGDVRMLDRTLRDALRRTRARLSKPVAPVLVGRAGLPPAEVTRALLDAAEATVYGRARAAAMRG